MPNTSNSSVSAIAARRRWFSQCQTGLLGFGLGEFWAIQSQAATTPTPLDSGSAFGRAKACIVVFLFGAPAHQDTWDLKPEAPADVRGEFLPISSSCPDIFVSEHLPRCAERMHRLTQIRSVTHPDNTHTVAMHYMLTGVRHKRPASNPQNAADDFPCFGAVANYWERNRKFPKSRSALPAGVSLNAPANQVSANNHIFPGFFAGFLGTKHDPLFVPQPPDSAKFAPFETTDATQRLKERDRLRSALGAYSGIDGTSRVAQDSEAGYERAFNLLTSPQTLSAFALERETDSLRQQYGMTPFGQGCLLARRLVEAGVSLVTVNWQRDDAYWDTHADNFGLHKKKLLPNFDRGFSALLDDLADRGMLDETLVVVLGEFGRTPKINANAGRDHWAACNTVVLAGAGLPGGQVYGASDRIAAYPSKNPVTPDDLAATIYHLLGVPSHTILPTQEGRPMTLCTGEPLRTIL